MNLGSTVDLYYYGENNSVRSIRGSITDANASWVIITDAFGTQQGFPLTSIQRMILTDSE